MRRLQTFAFLFASLAIVGLLAAACDSGTQEPAASAADAIEIELEDGAANSATSEPPVIEASRYPADLPKGVTAEIPSNFPSEVPIYPGAVPAQGKGVEFEGVPMSAVQLLTLDPPKKVYEYYHDKLENDGWVFEDDEAGRERNSIQARKGDCQAKMLIAPSEDGGSDIFLVTEC